MKVWAKKKLSLAVGAVLCIILVVWGVFRLCQSPPPPPPASHTPYKHLQLCIDKYRETTGQYPEKLLLLELQTDWYPIYGVMVASTMLGDDDFYVVHYFGNDGPKETEVIEYHREGPEGPITLKAYPLDGWR